MVNSNTTFKNQLHKMDRRDSERRKKNICFLIGIQLLKNIENSYFFPRPFKKAGTSNCALRESWFGVDENSTGVRAFIIVVVFVCFFFMIMHLLVSRNRQSAMCFDGGKRKEEEEEEEA